jgi:hypothetical protein
VGGGWTSEQPGKSLLGLVADRHDVGRGLPNFFIGHDVAPRRHAEAAFLPAVRDRLEDTFGIKIASGEIYPTPAVLPMTMGTLLLQKQIMARRNHARVFEIRNVILRIGSVANANGGDRHQHQSVHHGKQSDSDAG